MKDCVGMFVVSILVLIGCQFSGGSTGCDRIVDAKLRLAPIAMLNADNLEDWVLTTYQLSPANLVIVLARENDDNSGASAVRWKNDLGSYYAFISPHARHIWLKPNNRLTINAVLACFGAPAMYLASDKVYADGFEVSLWYPDAGLVFEHKVITRGFGRLPDLSVNDNTTIELVKRVEPGSIEEMIANAYGQGSDAEFRNKVFRALKPWPGEVSKIVIDR